MNERNNTIRKLSFSVAIFAISIVFVLIFSSLLLKKTEVESEIARDFFAEVNEIDINDKNLEVTQILNFEEQIHLVDDISALETEVNRMDDSNDEPGQIPEVSISSLDPKVPLYVEDEVKNLLSEKDFLFQAGMIYVNKQDPDIYIESIEQMIKIYDETKPPETIKPEVEKLLSDLDKYKGFLVQNSELFEYFYSLNSEFEDYLKNNGSLRAYLEEVKTLTIPGIADEFHSTYVLDMEILDSLTVKERPTDSESLQDEPVSYPAATTIKNNNKTEEMLINDISKIKIKLHSELSSYPIDNIIDLPSIDNLNNLLLEIRDSLKTISEYEETV